MLAGSQVIYYNQNYLALPNLNCKDNTNDGNNIDDDDGDDDDEVDEEDDDINDNMNSTDDGEGR